MFLQYYMLQSSLQIQCSALLDDGPLHAHYLTPGCTCCKGFFQNYLHPVFELFIITEYKFTISVIQFALFQVFIGVFSGPAAGDSSSWVIVLVCGCDPPVGVSWQL